MTYFLTPEAEVELAEAVDFYALNASPKVARNFLALFEEKGGAPVVPLAPYRRMAK